MTENIFIALIGLLGGGTITEIVRHFLNRQTELQKLVQSVNDLSEKVDRNTAISARRCILSFSDETMRKVRHSKESFDQALEDIDTYESYCDDHPKFENNKTVLATKRIKEVYEKCVEEGDFL